MKNFEHSRDAFETLHKLYGTIFGITPNLNQKDNGSYTEDVMDISWNSWCSALEYADCVSISPETVLGWAISYACDALDNGQDIRKIEIPLILEQMHKDLGIKK